jgi:hypothetical protein
MGILYDGKPNNLIIMQGWTYSYWAGAVTTERSTSGHVFLLGGRLVSWQSQKQATSKPRWTRYTYLPTYILPFHIVHPIIVLTFKMTWLLFPKLHP